MLSAGIASMARVSVIAEEVYTPPRAQSREVQVAAFLKLCKP
jgi:hypothetical protein